MKITIEDFISSFHSLSGTTIGEKCKNLQLLLNKAKETGGGELDFSLLHPKTPLEEKFKVQALIYFRRVPDLLEVIKSENPTLIENVLKVGPWFFEEAFGNVTGEELTTLVLPRISFNAKVKLLNKLSLHLKNSQKADDFFKATKEKYGFYLASKLLPSCSADLIVECIKHNKFKMAPRQLLIIIKKYPKLTETVLKKLSGKVNVRQEYKIIFMHLAQHDTLLFLKLHKEYDLYLHLGWRRTSKIVQANKQDVINNPTQYYKSLHNKQIAKSLNRDFQHLYINLFPLSLKQFKKSSYEEVLSIVTQLPVKMQNADLLSKTFEKVYGSSLWEHPELISLKWLDILSSNERDLRIKPESKPSAIPEEKWNCYLKTKESIPYLKKVISLSSDIKNRAELVSLLVETCRINKDEDALAEMCTYMTTRHRNDHVSVRLAFVNKLRKSFKLEDLEERHWTPINELVQLFALNDEQFFYLSDYLRGYIQFRLKHDLPIKEQIKQWLKSYPDELNIIQEEPNFEKQCLLTSGEVIHEVFKDLNLPGYISKFLSAIINWNKRHPEDKISAFAFPAVLNSCKTSLMANHYVYYADPLLKYLFSTKFGSKTEAAQRKDLINLYLSKADNLYQNSEISNWLIKYELISVKKNIEIVARRLLKMHNLSTTWPFWQYCRYYTHLEISQEIIKICLAVLEENLQDEDFDTIRKNIVLVLSHLMTSEEFKSFIVSYYPSNVRVDAKSEEGKKLQIMQQNIGTCLRYFIPRSEALESVLIFCKSLKLVQSSLYSLVGSINEDKLPLFLDKLAGQSLSNKKLALRLSFRVLDKGQILNALNAFVQAEKNLSMRRFIFRSACNYFIRNPDDYSWELLRSSMKTAEISDKRTFDVLMQIEKIPVDYFARYVLFAWDILDKLPDPEGTVETNKAILLSSLKADVVKLLPENFCTDLIKKYLFKCNKDTLTYFQSQVQRFTCWYIICCEKEQEERLKTSFAVLKDYVNTTWRNSENRAGARGCLSNFLNEFCTIFLTDGCTNRKILSEFADLWNSFLKPHDAFNDYLYLQCTMIYMEKLSLPQVGQRLAKLCDSLTNTYGAFIVPMFSKSVNIFFKYFAGGEGDVLEKNRYTLIENLVGPDSSTACLILALLLITANEPTILETEEKCKGIIGMLKKRSDPAIRMYLDSRLKSCTALDC